MRIKGMLFQKKIGNIHIRYYTRNSFV